MWEEVANLNGNDSHLTFSIFERFKAKLFSELIILPVFSGVILRKVFLIGNLPWLLTCFRKNC